MKLIKKIIKKMKLKEIKKKKNLIRMKKVKVQVIKRIKFLIWNNSIIECKIILFYYLIKNYII